MAHGFIICLCLAIAAAHAFPSKKQREVVAEAKPGHEYVFIQSAAPGAKPIARKDKATEEERPFETSHKVPASLTFALNTQDEDDAPVNKPGKSAKGKKVHKRDTQGPAPAPAGAIKLDIKALLKKYETELKTSTTTTPKPKRASSSAKAAGKRRANKRVKKEARHARISVTSPRPILTTGKPVPKPIDDDLPLAGAASDKQRSRIQIKKGPNGQEYEYEYVYYYYDDDEDSKDKPVTNAHDGPARNTISRGDKSREKHTPEANEVVPSRGSKTKSRQLGEEETVNEERLPANTRFPPRSRNLNTTPLPEEETKAPTTVRGRGRGRPTTEATISAAEADNVSDETQGSRGRTRANVRRPSLDLVDSDSFNTHSVSPAKPSFPQDLPDGPESEEEADQVSDEKKQKTDDDSSTEEATTVRSPMEKVALDLYAISQGTQKLFGESDTADGNIDATEGSEVTTETVTEAETTTTTTTTSTTTTTTTTPAPTTTTTTTTTTEAAPFGRGKFGGRRGGIGGRKTSTATEASTTEASKPKGKFGNGRPSFGGRNRPSKTTAAPVEEEAHKEEAKPASQSRPTLSRNRFGGSRPRGRTTAATEEPKEESSASTSAPSHRPSLPRARPSFNTRNRGRTTPSTSSPAEPTGEETATSTAEIATTTARTRKLGAGPGVRPLRPGPRINLATRGRGASTTTTTEAPAEKPEEEKEEEEETHDQEASEKEETPVPVDNSPLGRLRNKNRLNIQPARPKAAASTPVQVRRVNPLLARRRPGQTTEAPSSEAPQEHSTEDSEAVEEEATEDASSSSSTTTEEPKGLNKLLAGRRRPGVRTPGTLAHRS